MILFYIGVYTFLLEAETYDFQVTATTRDMEKFRVADIPGTQVLQMVRERKGEQKALE
jgi:hypothetical protein